MKYHTRTTHSTDVTLPNGDEVSIELEHVPCDWMDSHTEVVGNRIIVAYLVSDNDYRSVDDLMGDCMGRIVDAYNGRDAEKHELYELAGYDRYGNKDLDAVWDKHEDEAIRRYVERIVGSHSDEDTITEYEERDASCERMEGETAAETARRYVTADAQGASYWTYVMQEDDMQAVLEDMWDEPAYWPGNPDAVFLDVYDHSGQCWSISGGGMQCRWDTSHGAGAWVPDKYLLDQLDSDVVKGKDRRAQCELYAQQFLDTYNDIIGGNIYGCVVQVHDLDGELIDEDACWGFIGSEYAEESLKSEFFNPAVAKAEVEWAEVQHLAEVKADLLEYLEPPQQGAQP